MNKNTNKYKENAKDYRNDAMYQNKIDKEKDDGDITAEDLYDQVTTVMKEIENGGEATIIIRKPAKGMKTKVNVRAAKSPCVFVSTENTFAEFLEKVIAEDGGEESPLYQFMKGIMDEEKAGKHVDVSLSAYVYDDDDIEDDTIDEEDDCSECNCECEKSKNMVDAESKCCVGVDAFWMEKINNDIKTLDSKLNSIIDGIAALGIITGMGPVRATTTKLKAHKIKGVVTKKHLKKLRKDIISDVEDILEDYTSRLCGAISERINHVSINQERIVSTINKAFKDDETTEKKSSATAPAKAPKAVKEESKENTTPKKAPGPNKKS